VPYRVGAALNEENQKSNESHCHGRMKRAGATIDLRLASSGLSLLVAKHPGRIEPSRPPRRHIGGQQRCCDQQERRPDEWRRIERSTSNSIQRTSRVAAADTAAPWTPSDPCDTERRPFGSGTRGRSRPATDTPTLKSHESPPTGHCICATRCSCGPSKESILRSKSDSRCYGCNSSAGRRGRKQLEKKRNTGNAFPMVVAARRGLKRD
jgi:hypothetical protein